MAQLLDSTIVITVERRGVRLNDLIVPTPDEPSALASITASELLVGVHRADEAKRQLQRTAFVEDVLRRFPVLPFDLRVARLHAELPARLMLSGTMIGAHDLIIAATALAHGYAVLTENPRAFGRVPGLTVTQSQW